jgi:hypothetical protein
VKPAPKLAVAAPQTAVAAAPLPKPSGPQSAGPRNAGDVARLLASQTPVANAPASSAPRPLVPQVAAAQPMPQNASGVVMQAVPYDPYAGPVAQKKPAAKPKAVAKAVAPAKPGVVPALRVAAGEY